MYRVTDACEENLEAYISAISRLNSRIKWPFYTYITCKSVENELTLLKSFFLQRQTGMSRNGILILLDSIHDYTQYRTFVSLHRELIQVCISLEVDKEGEGPYTFFYFVYKNQSRAIDLLNCAAGIYGCFGVYTHKVLAYLFQLGNHVTADGGVQDDTGKFMNFFFRRTDIFSEEFRSIRNGLKRAPLPAGCRITEKNMIPTKGDMHGRGKIPYIIDSGEVKFVYKPRDMRLDYLIMEALSFFNGFLDEKYRLPVLQIHLLLDNTGLMQFAIHAEEMDEEQAQAYFLKFGVLLYFSKLFGIDDLHTENIMATLQGPVIIDLECALMPGLIKEKSIANDNLARVSEAFREKIKKEATFSVKLSEKQVFLPLRVFEASILEGFSYAAGCCRQHKQELEGYYENMRKQPFYYRVVPVHTSGFYTYMHDLISFSTDNSQACKILKCAFNEIVDDLHKKYLPSQTKEDFINCLEADALVKTMHTGMFWGNIPLFQFIDTVDEYGNIFCMGYIDGVPLFKYPIPSGPLGQLLAEFSEQIDWLASEEAAQSVRGLL